MIITTSARAFAGSAALLLLASCSGRDAEEVISPPAEGSVGDAPKAAPAPDRGSADRGHPKGGGMGKDEVEVYVTNPANGAKLAVYVHLPDGPGPHKAIVAVPGAGGDASTVMNAAEHRDDMMRRGIAVIRFDPDGRGNSEGEDDMGGTVHQRGLRTIIAYTSQRDDIADDQVGVLSYSYGITMSSGALADGATKARFLIDWEGPSNREYTGCSGGKKKLERPSGEGVACDDDSYWNEREAIRFIDDVEVPYLRIQRADDHVHHEDRSHALALLEGAMEGDAPWVNMNDLQPNADLSVYQQADLPDVEIRQVLAWFPDWCEDMFVVAEGGTPPKRDHSASEERRRGPGARDGQRGGRSGRGDMRRRQGERKGRRGR